MGATREIDEDANRDNAKKAPVGTCRVSTMADWPLLFHDLQGAIRYLMGRGPLWYELEQKTVYGDWKVLVSRSQSRHNNDYIGEDRS